MKLHKLDAINSTNDYLKELIKTSKVPSFTVVYANYQTYGRGQLLNKWHSKKGKNLLMSLLLKFDGLRVDHQAYLNFTVSLAIYDVLSRYLPNIKIKWPNDILSRQKKIAGILIENNVKNGKISYAIVGIGLNVNQLVFPKYLGNNVTSLKHCTKQNFKRIKLLKEIVIAIEHRIKTLETGFFEELKNDYEKNMFAMNKVAMYHNKKEGIFMGKITGVSELGELFVVLDNEKKRSFSVKEISYIL